MELDVNALQLFAVEDGLDFVMQDDPCTSSCFYTCGITGMLGTETVTR